jgi:hypothetical protein
MRDSPLATLFRIFFFTVADEEQGTLVVDHGAGRAVCADRSSVLIVRVERTRMTSSAQRNCRFGAEVGSRRNQASYWVSPSLAPSASDGRNAAPSP